ncbi:MAG: squalene synthase HpnC [Planctomycetaceae bacterium]|nr:squalene synthase HpnC [Planctomycetaceae bacterium]MBT6458672.1 squalene synthase HpnC [Planctomycetaceae bacterium]MBT7729030.1 squalene synthase HpnC [Planctomycetaceae bacterium]
MSAVNAELPQVAQRDPAAWQLARLPADLELSSAEMFCRQVAAAHYENFTVATRLVPSDLRQDLANVYTFARWSDDLADESEGDATVALSEWACGLDACFAGTPTHPVFVALSETVRRHSLSLNPFADLIDAFIQDQTVTRYESRDQLLEYCRRSADPVGRIVLGLAHCKGDEEIRLSDSICTGLQLVNFWQDVRRDYLGGRIYIPAEDMRRHGVTEDMLNASSASQEFISLLTDEVEWAEQWFGNGQSLVKTAPSVLRPAIQLFLEGGRGVAQAIRRAGFDTLTKRPVLKKRAKMNLAFRAAVHMVTIRVRHIFQGT